MFDMKVRGIKSLNTHIEKIEKSLVPYSEKVLGEFAKKVSLEAQKNIKKRAGWSPKPPHYRTKNTGKHLRDASGRLKQSLYGIAKGSPTDYSVYDKKVTPKGVRLTFGTKAVNERTGFSYPYLHEVSQGRFPFFYSHATEKLLGHFADKYLGMIGGK